MKTKSIATRRRFFLQAGAALSVPLAASAAHASARADDSDAQARLAKFEDVDAIRALQRNYVRLVNSGARDEARRLFADPATAEVAPSVRSLSADGFGEHDAIEIAADRKTASARTHCTVQTETAIGPNCTLVEMARAQGEGMLRRAEKRVLVSTYVHRDGAWRIERLMWERL